MKKIIVLFAITILSCGHRLKEGVVKQMYIEPERTYIYMMPIPHTIRSGKVTTTHYTYIPVTMHDDTDYVIVVHGHDEENEELEEKFYLNESQYKCISKGDNFKVTEDCSNESNKDRKL